MAILPLVPPSSKMFDLLIMKIINCCTRLEKSLNADFVTINIEVSYVKFDQQFPDASLSTPSPKKQTNKQTFR